MEIRVRGEGTEAPFHAARDVFKTNYSLSLPVIVDIQSDPDERTWTAHYDDHHVLNMSAQTASSAMARELALHEFSHMHRYEERHASHIQSTREAIYLALAGEKIQQKTISHCYQIANHMKDIYADDLTLSLDTGDKLVSFLESELAAALINRPHQSLNRDWQRLTPASDPNITVINAAFALALLERHNCITDDHRLYDLAHIASTDAPQLPLETFKHRFRSLAADPDQSEYRKVLVNIVREYATHAKLTAT